MASTASRAAPRAERCAARGRLDLGFETRPAAVRPVAAVLRGARLREESVELERELQMFRTAVGNLLLGLAQPVFEFAHAAARAFEVRLDDAMPSRLFLDARRWRAAAPLALEHAFVRVACRD